MAGQNGGTATRELLKTSIIVKDSPATARAVVVGAAATNTTCVC